MEQRFVEWRRENFDAFQRTVALGAKLWGNAEHLEHQLLLSSPEIPSGATMKDLLTLEWLARERCSVNQKWMSKPPIAVIVVGARHFNIYEAMYEVVRRAIASLGDK